MGVSHDEEIIRSCGNNCPNQLKRLIAKVLRLINDHGTIRACGASLFDQVATIPYHVDQLLLAMFQELRAILLKNLPHFAPLLTTETRSTTQPGSLNVGLFSCEPLRLYH